MRTIGPRWLAVACTAALACDRATEPSADGSLAASLTQTPNDVGCLVVSVTGSRVVEQRATLTPGRPAAILVTRLPAGIVQVDASAFEPACDRLAPGATARYVTDSPQSVRIDRSAVASVTLRLIRNGRLSVDVDFEGNRFDPRDEAALLDLELLGKRIFEDVNLSEPRGQSCASCHDVAAAFTGNHGSRIPAVSLGSRPEVFGGRNAPTAKYAAFSPPFAFVLDGEGPDAEHVPVGGQFWDGRASSLAEQAKAPFLNPREMNNPSKAAVIAKIAAGSYADSFRRVFGADAFADVDAAYDDMADAIAAFERSDGFSPFSSKFDDFLRGQATLSEQEQRGFALFKDPEKGNCLACHVGNEDSRDPRDWLFTDFTYDNLGVPRNLAIPDNGDPAFFDLGLCRQAGIVDKAPPGFDVSSLCGAFKVPTLRNVAVTAPYMHNGFFTNLRDVVRFYVTRDTHPELWYPVRGDGSIQRFDDLPPEHHGNVNTTEPPYDRKPGELPRLTEAEIDDVVAFLHTLTDR